MKVEISDIIIVLEATAMHLNDLNRVVLTLVTHPLLEMTTIIIKNATALHTAANALAHLILKLR